RAYISHSQSVSFLRISRAPRSALFPYTTLFRSHLRGRGAHRVPLAQVQGVADPDDVARRRPQRRRAGNRPRALGRLPALLRWGRSEEHTSELQSPYDLVCRLLLEKKNRLATGLR